MGLKSVKELINEGKLSPSFKDYADSLVEGTHRSTMTQKEYFLQFKSICEAMIDLTSRKNTDYAELEDAFANFKMIEQMTQGRISTESGIVVRLTDKLKRVASLLARPALVKDESIEDTVMDMAVYSVILLIWLRYKRSMGGIQRQTTGAGISTQVSKNEILDDETRNAKEDPRYKDKL